MRVIHVFNSNTINGPEMQVIPALLHSSWEYEVWLLHEARRGVHSSLQQYCHTLRIPTQRIEVRSRFDIGALARLRTHLSSLEQAVIVHSHDAKASVYCWIAIASLFRKKIRSIVTHHGVVGRPNALSRCYESIFTKGTKFFADCVLTVCQFDFKLLLKRGVPARKVRVHFNGIDRPPLRWEDRRVLASQSKIRLVVVGRLSKEKNHSALLRVLAAMNSQQKDSLKWSLDIIGEGSLKSHLQGLCVALGLCEQVRFLGYQHEAWRCLDLYDALLSFSLGEGFPVNVLEAGWRSTPVFCSKVGGIPELCGDEGAMYFSLNEPDIEIAKRLALFLDNEADRRNRAAHLLNRIQTHFTQSHWLDSASKIYEAVAGYSA